jgi:Cu(I)/Ag(I) efflux system membrane fusion protein
MRGRYAALSILALAAGVSVGVYLERFHLNPAAGMAPGGPEILYWVAPMDPNFRQPNPGQSPMGMDLVPVYAGQEPSGDPAEVTLSAAEINAIGVRTALAQVSEISHRIETVGFVGYDEHLTTHVHTRVDGWIETLNVRAIGDRVRKGDLLFEMFSPQIGASTAELVRAMEAGQTGIVRLARGKLRSLGMSDAQIAEVEASGELARNLKVMAPQDGVVVSLEAADGMFLQPGTRAVSLTDLRSVWLIVDVFERDIARMTGDMRAVARFEHLSGRTFEGVIDYIYPELDPVTRTLPVRLRLDNDEGLLRPNMFGAVSLIPTRTRTALTVPSEAIIRTGTAERVILKTGVGAFKPRLVTTGLRDNFGGGGRTEVVQGLTPGEEVVASAQFLIDSESALSAGLMRMAPTDEAPASGTGVLVSLDRAARIAEIRHGALDSLDWPAMTSRFTVRFDVPLDRLMAGQQVRFRAARGADGLLGLIALGGDDGIAATGRGMVMAVTPDGKLSMSHDPIPELGWPAMVMDMPVAGVDPGAVPLNAPVEFDLSKGGDGMFAIVAVRAQAQAVDAGAAAPMAMPPAPMLTTPAAPMPAMPIPAMPMPDKAPPIIVSGTIIDIDPAARTASISHGPIKEIGMPGMTMRFALADTLDIGALSIGVETALTFARPDGMTMILAAAAVPAPPPMEVAGTINTLDRAARTANITHGPMTEIGMPGMTMDFAVDPSLDPGAIATGRAVTLLLRRNEDFSMTLVGVAPGAAVIR